MVETQPEEASTSESVREGDDIDSIDVAVADALKAAKNRQTGKFRAFGNQK